MKKCFGIVFPSAKPDKKFVERAVLDLEGRGVRVKVGEWGDDETRAKNFMKMWCDPEVDVVWAGRGGYGAMRILPYLDFAKLPEKPFVGMSDITALHLAIHKECGFATYLGPMVESYAKSSFARDEMHKTLEMPKAESGECIVGGNMTLISSTIGTPWEINTKGKTLLLEEVGEEAYRIDRMFCQLKLAGKLDHLSGLVLGTWSRCSGDLDAIFDHYTNDLACPVIRNFPTGHIEDQVTIVLNGKAQLPINVF